eukprot:3912055-Rhodomonas_salina.1
MEGSRIGGCRAVRQTGEGGKEDGGEGEGGGEGKRGEGKRERERGCEHSVHPIGHTHVCTTDPRHA